MIILKKTTVGSFGLYTYINVLHALNASILLEIKMYIKIKRENPNMQIKNSIDHEVLLCIIKDFYIFILFIFNFL